MCLCTFTLRAKLVSFEYYHQNKIDGCMTFSCDWNFSTSIHNTLSWVKIHFSNFYLITKIIGLFLHNSVLTLWEYILSNQFMNKWLYPLTSWRHKIARFSTYVSHETFNHIGLLWVQSITTKIDILSLWPSIFETYKIYL